MAVCVKCGVDKSYDEYAHYNCKSTRENPGVCKKCITKIASSDWYKLLSVEQKKKVCDYQKQWRIDNPERVKELDRKHQIQRQSDPEKRNRRIQQSRERYSKYAADPEWRAMNNARARNAHHAMSPEKKKEHAEKQKIKAKERYNDPLIKPVILERQRKSAKQARNDEIKGPAKRKRCMEWRRKNPEKQKAQREKYAANHGDVISAYARKVRAEVRDVYIKDCFRHYGVKDVSLVTPEMIELQRLKILLSRDIKQKMEEVT